MKRILLNWYYHRHDLTAYLLEVFKDHELVFVFWQGPVGEPDYITEQANVSAVYWGDYSSPYQMLDKIRPDFVVFADLESFNQIALNIAARNRGLRTFVLQHGIRGDYEVHEAISVAKATGPQAVTFSNTSRWSMKFLASALRLRNVPALPRLLRFIYDRKRADLTAALFKHQFELRRADYYIELSDDNTSYHRKRDGVPEDRFRIVGNPAFDEYFDYLNRHASETKGYALLIDCPFLEAGFGQDHGIDAARKNEYLQRLDDWSKTNGLKLKVKLHPLTFKAEGLYESGNLTYHRAEDLKELIAGADVVYFIHFSTVTPVILAYKPCVYFSAALPDHAAQIRKLSVPELPLFTFDTSRPNLAETAARVPAETVLPLLYSADGGAALRVRHTLLTL